MVIPLEKKVDELLFLLFMLVLLLLLLEDALDEWKAKRMQSYQTKRKPRAFFLPEVGPAP